MRNIRQSNKAGGTNGIRIEAKNHLGGEVSNRYGKERAKSGERGYQSDGGKKKLLASKRNLAFPSVEIGASYLGRQKRGLKGRK